MKTKQIKIRFGSKNRLTKKKKKKKTNPKTTPHRNAGKEKWGFQLG